MKRPSFLFLFAQALSLCAVASVIIFLLMQARTKMFWIDESHEIINTCALSWETLLQKGAIGSGSLSPLYFLLQKAYFTFRDSFWQVNLDYRIVNISLVFVWLCSVLLFFWRMRLPLAGTGAVVAAMASGYLLSYGSEARPTAAWMAIYGLALLATCQLSIKPWFKITRVEKTFFSFALLCLALVASPGFMQAASLVGSVFLLHLCSERVPSKTNFLPAPKVLRSTLAFYLPVLIIVTSAGLYYLLANLGQSGAAMREGGRFDFFAQIQQGNLDLVKAVLRLFAPKGGFFYLPLHVLFLLGLVSVFFRRFSLQRFALLAWGQLLVFVVIAALTIHKQYYFLPRIFIFCIPLHMLFVALGTQFFWESTRCFPSCFSQKAKGVGIALGFCLVFGFGLYLMPTKRYRPSVLWQKDNPLVGKQCDDFHGRYTIIWEKAFVDPDASSYQIFFLNRFAEQLKACGWRPSDDTTIVLAKQWNAPEDWYELLQAAGGYHDLNVCGLQAHFP